MEKKNLSRQLIESWQTSNRVTEFFVEHLPEDLWSMKIPGTPRKTIRMLLGHLHNARCMWIKMIGKQFNIQPPKSIERKNVSRSVLLKALHKSDQSMVALLRASLDQDGILPMKIPFANIPSDATHFTSYMIAHEAHHRGQIVLVARQLGLRLPPEITSGLWQWKKFHKESQLKK